MSDPKVIYLAPACEAESGDGRTWAEDNPWPDCDCGHRPVMYVIGETFSRMKSERDALQLRLNNSEQWNDELLGLLRKAAEFEVGENDSEDWQHLLSQISLQLTPIGVLKPAEATHDFSMIGTEKMPPMEYDEP